MKMLILNLLIYTFLFFSCKEDYYGKNDIKISNSIKKENTIDDSPMFDYFKIKSKANDAFLFCEKQNYNTDFCILIDFSIHSGLNRFFIWDFKKDSIQKSMLVSHGCGDFNWANDESKENPLFSNDDGSHCSSLGKYKIGKRDRSEWGIKIKYYLHGLENTNNNAYKRTIVLHSWEMVKNEETYPVGTPEGWGCPAISDSNMVYVDNMLKIAKKPVLMWIYS